MLFRTGYLEARAYFLAVIAGSAVSVIGGVLTAVGFLAATAYEGERRGVFQLLNDGDPGLLGACLFICVGIVFLLCALGIFALFPRHLLRMWAQEESG